MQIIPVVAGNMHIFPAAAIPRADTVDISRPFATGQGRKTRSAIGYEHGPKGSSALRGANHAPLKANNNQGQALSTVIRVKTTVTGRLATTFGFWGATFLHLRCAWPCTNLYLLEHGFLSRQSKPQASKRAFSDQLPTVVA
jgi:hypothetical protein